MEYYIAGLPVDDFYDEETIRKCGLDNGYLTEGDTLIALPEDGESLEDKLGKFLIVKVHYDGACEVETIEMYNLDDTRDMEPPCFCDWPWNNHDDDCPWWVWKMQ